MKGALSELMKYVYRTLTVWLFIGLFSLIPAAIAEPLFEAAPEIVRVYDGVPFILEYTLRWTGEADDYQVAPLTLAPFDWGNARLLDMRASGAGSEHWVVQLVEVLANAPGNVEFPALAIRLAPKSEVSAPLILHAEPVTVSVRPDHRLYWGGGLLAGLALIVVAVWVFWRRKQGVADTIAPTPEQKAQAALHLARRSRLDGRFYEFYLALAEAAKAMAGREATEDLETALRRHAQAVGYQGIRPSDDEMDSALRDVERLLRIVKEETKE
jgi:hypothetical protein